MGDTSLLIFGIFNASMFVEFLDLEQSSMGPTINNL